MKSSPHQQSKCRKIVDLYIHTTGDLNKNNGLEIEFLLDTGKTCSVINFNTFIKPYQTLVKILPLFKPKLAYLRSIILKSESWVPQFFPQFQDLEIIWTPEKNLAFPDILSRNVTITHMIKYQKKHKHNPNDIKFYDNQGEEVKCFIEHDDEGFAPNDFHPVLFTTSTDKRRLLLINDGHDFKLLSLLQTSSVH